MSSFVRSLRHSPLLAIGLAIVALLLVVAVFAPVIATYDPLAISGDSFESPSGAHLLGTNDAGADIFSRLIWGTRTSLTVAFLTTSLVLAIGTSVGLVAGLRGGLIDTLLMRIIDVFLALPGLPLLIFVAALVGPNLWVSILMIGLALWPQTARIVRSQTLSLRTRGYIDSARGFGAGTTYVMRHHLLPALGPIVASNLVFVAGAAVTIEAGLAFIGLGDPIAVGWGTMLNRALENPQIYLGSLWIWWLMPAGLALTLSVLGFTFIGVGLEPRFNPRGSR